MKNPSRRHLGGLALAAFVVCGFGLTGCAAGTQSAATSTSAIETSSAASATTATTAVESSYWNSCRRGETDDLYPGECHDYVDSDSDNICDLSQSAPGDSATAYEMASSDDTSNQPHTRGRPLGPCSICRICTSIV